MQETACTTRYVETSPGKFVADTACEKVPVSYCTRDNCRMVPGPQECHDKVGSITTGVGSHREFILIKRKTVVDSGYGFPSL